MKQKFEVKIRHKGKPPIFEKGVCSYYLEINNTTVAYCWLDIYLGRVNQDFKEEYLEILNIEKGNYTSYKNKFQEFGVILEEKARIEILERFKVFSTLKEGIYNVMYFFEDNKADLLQIDIPNEKVIYHFLDQHLNNLDIKNKNFKAYINKFKEIGLNIEEEAVYED